MYFGYDTLAFDYTLKQYKLLWMNITWRTSNVGFTITKT